MPTVRANGINIEYEIDGSGEPLLLIAGLGYSRWMWHKMVPALAQEFKVITFDNRGVGGSDKPKGPYTAQLLAADTAALLSALDIESAAVMGHSMGGYVAQALALEYPYLIDKLILSATNFGGSNHIRITQEALVVLMDTRGDPLERLRNGIAVSTAPGFPEKKPAVVDEWIAHRAANPLHPEGYEAQLAIGLNLFSDENCFEPRLHEIDAPTLILFGKHDRVVPIGNAELLARRIRNSSVTILPDAGHLYPLETPDEAVTAVTDFLQS